MLYDLFDMVSDGLSSMVARTCRMEKKHDASTKMAFSIDPGVISFTNFSTVATIRTTSHGVYHVASGENHWIQIGISEMMKFCGGNVVKTSNFRDFGHRFEMVLQVSLCGSVATSAACGSLSAAAKLIAYQVSQS